MICANHGCRKKVPGIYCPECREHKAKQRADAIARAEESRAAAMRERWGQDRDGMIGAIKAGKGVGDAPRNARKRKATGGDLPS